MDDDEAVVKNEPLGRRIAVPPARVDSLVEQRSADAFSDGPPSPFQGMQCDWHLEDPRDTALLGTSGAGSLQGAGRQ